MNGLSVGVSACVLYVLSPLRDAVHFPVCRLLPQTPNPTPPASRARSRPCASVSFLTYSLFLFTRAHVPSDGPSTNPPVPCYALASRLHASRHAPCPSPLPSRCLGPCLLSYAMHPTSPLTHLLSIYSRRRSHDLPLPPPPFFIPHALLLVCIT